MAKKIPRNQKIINISLSPGAFTSIFKRFVGGRKGAEFSDISELRQILSNEKARVLYTIKNKSPESIYSLSKILDRDFKSVIEDVRALEKFGFIELVKNVKSNRTRLKPVLSTSSIQINFEI
jgi:predicted transcriptional regulator